MKKKVAFQKEIQFPTMIGEISAISLENELKFVDGSNIEGNLLLTGKYKMTEASRLEEDFSYKIPTEIALTEKLDLNTSKVEIVDFFYEINNEDTMICNIELLIDGVEIIEVDEIEELDRSSDEERECDGDKKEMKEIEIPKIEKVETIEKENNKEIISREEKKEIIKEEIISKEENISTKESSLFINLGEEEETYGTFLVYIVRQNESINSIIEKYNTNIEEIEKYNNLNDLNIGTKLIIPILND